MVDTGSAAGLDGSIAKAYERQQGWLGYYWAPTSILGKYDMVKLDAGVPYDKVAFEIRGFTREHGQFIEGLFNPLRDLLLVSERLLTQSPLVVGLPLGIAMSRWDRPQRLVNPTLDVMQTMPSFVYLISVVMSSDPLPFFGHTECSGGRARCGARLGD